MNSSSTLTNCITATLFELHTQSVINFSQFDYIRSKNSLPLYEVIIKIVLCLMSLVASLFGNLIVMYKILIKSRSSTNSLKLTVPSTKNESRLLRHENCVFMSLNAEQIKYRKSMSLDVERLNIQKKSIYKSYKSKSVNFFILNLCFCDLMIVMWCSWVHLINSISQNWIFGAFFCKLNTYIQGRYSSKIKDTFKKFEFYILKKLHNKFNIFSEFYFLK